MNYQNVSISLDGTIGFDQNTRALKSLENLALQSSFFSPDKEIIIDSLQKRAISEIRFVNYLIDTLANLIFCGNYETTLQKIDRFCKKAISLPEPKKAPLSISIKHNESYKAEVIKNADTIHGNIQMPKDNDVDTPHRNNKLLPSESDEPMSKFKNDMQELNKPLNPLIINFVTHELKKYADPLEAIDSKHLMRIVDNRYLTSEFLDRIEVLEILHKIKERLVGRPRFFELAIFLDKKIIDVKSYHLEICLNKLKGYDVAKLSYVTNLEELDGFIYRNNSFLTEQKGNVELYNVVYQLCENLKEINGPKDYSLKALIRISNSINKKNFNLLPVDVWLNIFKYIDKSNKHRKYSNWFCMFVLSKRMKYITQQHVNSRIYLQNIFIEGTLKKPVKAKDAIAYTVKNSVKSIRLSHNDLSVDDLKQLLEGSPDLTKIDIRSLSDEMLPILYGFKNLKILSLQGNIRCLDLTNFEVLEELNLNHLNVISVIFKENDQTIKKVTISGGDNTFAFERLLALESLEIDWWEGHSSLEIKSPVLKRLMLDSSSCNKIDIDKKIRSIEEIFIKKTSLAELTFPEELPHLKILEVFENSSLMRLALPVNAPALNSLIVQSNQLQTLKFPSNLHSCNRVVLRTGEVQRVAFPDQMPALESVEVESSKVEALFLPKSAPKVYVIRVVSCSQLVHLTLPSNPEEGATLNLSFTPNLDATEVVDINKYTESAF